MLKVLLLKNKLKTFIKLESSILNKILIIFYYYPFIGFSVTKITSKINFAYKYSKYTKSTISHALTKLIRSALNPILIREWTKKGFIYTLKTNENPKFKLFELAKQKYILKLKKEESSSKSKLNLKNTIFPIEKQKKFCELFNIPYDSKIFEKALKIAFLNSKGQTDIGLKNCTFVGGTPLLNKEIQIFLCKLFENIGLKGKVEVKGKIDINININK